MKIEKMTDDEVMSVFSELISTRVKVGTAYVNDPETGVLTHQILLATCGNLKAVSAPEALFVPLMPVITKEVSVH